MWGLVSFRREKLEVQLYQVREKSDWWSMGVAIIRNDSLSHRCQPWFYIHVGSSLLKYMTANNGWLFVSIFFLSEFEHQKLVWNLKKDQPHIKRSLLIGPQRPWPRAHAVVHHLFPQVMDFGLKTPVLCKTRIKWIKTDSQVCIQIPVLHGKEEINLMTPLNTLSVSPVK